MRYFIAVETLPHFRSKIAYYNLDQIDFIRAIFTDKPLEVLVHSTPLPNDLSSSPRQEYNALRI